MSEAIETIEPATGPAGQVAHPDHLEHSGRLEQKFYPCGDNAWCLVGNGLSNQTFVRGPEGIIAIDTGESVEEMQAALDALREVTDEPVVACIYSHFHYVSGTQAIVDEGAAELPVYGHERIAFNRDRYGTEVGPRTTRGIVHQFAIALPADGEDGLVNVGLGRFFQNPGHRPFTPGHLPVTVPVSRSGTFTIAGLRVEITPAPSDADDNVTIWFPELGVAVNNLVWPALFNIFAIRGEEYRDPRILLTGLEHLRSLGAEELIGAHGPPLSGRRVIRDAILDYSDSIQFLWDQTVRLANRGLSMNEIADTVRLPARFNRTYLTRQFYGLVEHHVKQIYAGLFGWFDESDERLFPLPPNEESGRVIDAMGGADRVRPMIEAALAAGDYRWALRLGSWLCRVTGEAADREKLAAALRGAARRTTSANARNWSLTRARELEGLADLSRFRQHRFRVEQVLSGNIRNYVHVLKVLLDAEAAAETEASLGWQFETGERVGLLLRRGVAVPTDGNEADHHLQLSRETWARLLAGKQQLSEALEDGSVVVDGDAALVARVLGLFDVAAFRHDEKR